MNANEYQAFTDELLRKLEADSRVIGLAAVGSMAGDTHQPDQWSDHDFFVVTESGQQNWFRTHRDWVPDPARIVLWFHETEHGVKALYDSGHLIEFAVFDMAELEQMPINACRVLLDRGEVAAAVVRRQADTSAKAVLSDDLLLGQFITNLLVGVARWERGERFSGRGFVDVWSMYSLLRLIARYIPAEKPVHLDNLDPLRRFEFAYPAIGAQINDLLGLDVPEAARGLLDLADGLLCDKVVPYPAAAVAAVRGKIGAKR